MCSIDQLCIAMGDVALMQPQTTLRWAQQLTAVEVEQKWWSMSHFPSEQPHPNLS